MPMTSEFFVFAVFFTIANILITDLPECGGTGRTMWIEVLVKPGTYDASLRS